MKETETHSGAHGGAEKISQEYLGELDDGATLADMEDCCRFAGGDFALELRGEKLHLFRVLVREGSQA